MLERVCTVSVSNLLNSAILLARSLEQVVLERRNRLSEHVAACYKQGGFPSPINDMLLSSHCSLEQVVLERYNRLGEQVAACYSGAALRPSPGELQQLFRQVTPPWR